MARSCVLQHSAALYRRALPVHGPCKLGFRRGGVCHSCTFIWSVERLLLRIADELKRRHVSRVFFLFSPDTEGCIPTDLMAVPWQVSELEEARKEDEENGHW